MKLRTVSNLEDGLQDELSWRKKELLTLKLLIGKGRDHQAVALRRAGLALMYAHWEGFVKSAGTLYVQFVANQKLKHRQLRANFLALAIKSELHSAVESSKASVFTRVAEYFVTRMDDTAKILWDGAVQTKSNLSSVRLREIIICLGLDYAPFALKEKTVIDKLRDDRNAIAHGRFYPVDAMEYERLNGEVLEMMEEYHNQIGSAANLAKYRL